MRCLNCGWENPDGSSVCAKCGKSLGYSGNERNVGFLHDEGGRNYGSARQVCRKTVIVRKESYGGANPQQLNEPVVCPHCKYPVVTNVSRCPNCGGLLTDGRHTVHMPMKQIAELRRQFEPECKLTMMPEENEEMNPQEMSFHGEEIVLNRENTEPDNCTITSREQAVLSCSDGKWYIENRSDMQTTYVQVTRKMELQEGDVIVLGDRRFKFQLKE